MTHFYMDLIMKLFLLVFLFSLFTTTHAGSIYQCEDASGHMSFSADPCATEAEALATLDSRTNQNKRLQNTSIKKKYIRNQSDFNQFVDQLSFKNMSHVLKGLEKNYFHGMKMTYLLAQENIQYTNDKAQYGQTYFDVDIEQHQKINRFSIAYTLRVKGKKEHNFLNLSNQQVISRMNSLGFGAPKIKNKQYNWAWQYGNMNCHFVYIRNEYSSKKSFEYSCSEVNS